MVWYDALAPGRGILGEALRIPADSGPEYRRFGTDDFNATDAVRTWVGEWTCTWDSYDPKHPKGSNWTRGDVYLYHGN